MKTLISAARHAVQRTLGSGPTPSQPAPEPTFREVGSQPPNLLLFNDCSDQVNYGAEALVAGLIRILETAMPGHTLRLVPSHWVMDPEEGWQRYFHPGLSLVQPDALWPEVADQFEFVADEWLAGRGGPGVNAYLKALTGVDVVILNGEGSLYRTNFSAVRELFVAWFAKTRLGIPTIFMNGLVHLTGVVPILPAMARKTFGVLDAVVVRDPWSLRNAQEFLPGVPVTLIADSALALSPAIDKPGAGVEALFRQLGNTDFFCFDPGPMPIDYKFGNRSSMYRLILEMKHMVPQAVIVANNPVGWPMLKQLAADTGSVYLEYQPKYQDLMSVLARAKFQISGRLHNTILGALVGCPVISIGSTSHKVHGVCELLGFDLPYDGTDLWSSMERIKADAARHLSGGPMLRSAIQQNAARLGVGSLEMGTLVKDVLTRHGKLGLARA
jgi:polysaccharide pyruvyl transferase WcaK-like protein